MFDNVYLDSWAVDANTIMLNAAVIGIAVAIGVIAVIVNAIRGIVIYKMAAQRKVPLAFLSFLPFAQGFILGQLSDDCKKGNFKKGGIIRFILPVTTLAKWVAYIVLWVNISGYVKDFALLCNKHPDWIPINEGFTALFSYVPSFIIFFAVFSILALVNHIFFNIVTYRIFAEYKPVTAVVMTALSVMFGSIMSLVLLFTAKNGDTKNYSFDISSQKENVFQKV